MPVHRVRRLVGCPGRFGWFVASELMDRIPLLGQGSRLKYYLLLLFSYLIAQFTGFDHLQSSYWLRCLKRIVGKRGPSAQTAIWRA
jgi:hypothetical protein